jgi:hypothetical protein
MSEAYTPGLLVHDTRGYPHADVKAAYGRSVANTWGVQGKPAKTAEAYERRLKEGRANARRLVACWNACDGINTDLLERHPAPFSELRAQRDDLFAALVRLVRQHGSDGIEYSGDHPIAVARAAIAKATGVTA